MVDLVLRADQGQKARWEKEVVWDAQELEDTMDLR
jgi:hypothetical protein